MKRMLIGSLMAMAFVAVAVAQTTSQTPPPAQQQQQQQTAPKPPDAAPQVVDVNATEAKLVGCIVLGSEANVYLFENAVDPAKKDDKARTFRLVVAPDMDVTPHVNHKIQLVGAAETKLVVPVPPATKVAEKDLPTFTVKTITHVADTCSEAGR